MEEVSEGFLEEALKQGSPGWVEFGFGYAENGVGIPELGEWVSKGRESGFQPVCRGIWPDK